MISLFLALALQASTDKLPPAGSIPHHVSQDELIMAPINAVFAGIAAGDAAAIRAQLVDGGSNTEVTEQPDGGRKVERLAWAEALAGLHSGPTKFEERLINHTIKSDGSVATVWGDYIFLVNGKIDHCGLDLFELVRAGSAWKIANSTSSQRTMGCPAR